MLHPTDGFNDKRLKRKPNDFYKPKQDNTTQDVYHRSLIGHAVRHVKQVKKIKTDGEERTVSVTIEDVDARVDSDSEAKVNAMEFKAFTNRSSVNFKQKKAKYLAEEPPVRKGLTATVRTRPVSGRTIFCCIQLIRERLSEKSTKVHATRPKGDLGIYLNFAYWPRGNVQVCILAVKILFFFSGGLFL